MLASLARDIFSVPATGAGVERLFNSAWDVCHYRRGSLNATTIQDLMMFRCISKFDIKNWDIDDSEDAASTPDERQVADEWQEDQLAQFILDPISDDKEDETEDSEDRSNRLQAMIELPNQRVKGKRRKSVASEPEDGELPLPQDDSNIQMCTSGRVRKRCRREDDIYEYHWNPRIKENNKKESIFSSNLLRIVAKFQVSKIRKNTTKNYIN